MTSAAAVAGLILTSSIVAAQTPAVAVLVATTAQDAPTIQPSASCLTDLGAFKAKIDKDGYWLGDGDGYGYPAGGWGFGYGFTMGAYMPPSGLGYQSARPGYEIRTLLSSANILARQGKQQSCEDVLATTDSIYKRYVAQMQDDRGKTASGPGWAQQQIAAARPIEGMAMSVRSDQLIGTELRNESDQGLGSVDDIVLSPTTGKIAYLVIGRGGIFGLDKEYVPVPWGDIQATPNMNMLVLDSTMVAMGDAPGVRKNQFFTPEQYAETSKKVDGYWKVHIVRKVGD
jgi:sporulation protein YlmC with PRC-barrel domain